jgi:hypothetical protein
VTVRPRADPPAGYLSARVEGAEVVALADTLPRIREALRGGTLYEYAAQHPAARMLAGRAPAYAAPLPGNGMQVVVRHSRHGGFFAPLTRDRFLAPTRAPRELHTSLRLTGLRVRTPPVIAYVVYPAGPLLRRTDVATREIEGGADLAALLAGTAQTCSRDAALTSTAALLSAMARAGVRHPDLNLKNILIAPDADATPAAFLLDVDRVRFDPPENAGRANAARVLRSARKWRDRHQAPITDAELARLERAALGHAE